ncbi:hypothetical protein [Bradyrhizobium altum]|uniref:hypothetical protein n=1 Tax=Bradyrhizobium altum TaxID=1571202 RepID=UPI001E28DE2B|nr:hypothetical protein [Bradyrhizobium altum]
MKPILRQTLPLTMLIAATAISIAPSARAEVPASCVKGVDLATLGPKSIVGQGPHGEKAASPEVLALSDADAAKIKEKHSRSAFPCRPSTSTGRSCRSRASPIR